MSHRDGGLELVVAVAFTNFQFDADALELRQARRVVPMDTTRLRLLRSLLERPGAPVTKQQLMHAGWGRPVSEGRLTMAIADLRQLLGSKRKGSLIETVPKVGYRFSGEVVSANATTLPSLPVEPLRVGLYVGRAHVSLELDDALERARQGRGGLVVLVGEPGIGKTRAVEELERARPDDVRSGWGYCREAGDTPPLEPWRQLLDQVHAGGAELELQGGWRAAFDRAAETIMSQLSAGPWLLVLDDLHRADSASLELLLRVADRLERSRVLLLATLRPHQSSEPSRHAGLLGQVVSHKSCRRVAVEPLPASAVAEYVASQFVHPAAELAAAIYQGSEGIPFYMAELTRLAGATSSPQALRAPTLPSAALDLMRQRVLGVDPGAQLLLSWGSLLGRNISIGLLAEVVSLPRDAVRRGLQPALERDVLTPSDDEHLRFNHELLRKIVYDDIAPAQRRSWHARVASLLEARRCKGEPIAASEVAFHCHSALPEGDLRAAVRICREAADQAASVFGSADVAHHTHQALEALRLQPHPSRRLQMSLLYGVAIYSRPSDTSMYGRCVEELIALARSCRDGGMLARATALLHAHPRLVPMPGNAADLELAAGWLRGGDPGLKALVLASRAVRPAASFDAQQCIPFVQRAGQLVDAAMRQSSAEEEPGTSAARVLRAGDRGRFACNTALLHQLYLESGDRIRAADIDARLEQLLERSPVELSTVSIDIAFHRAALHVNVADLEVAELVLKDAESRARALAHTELLWHTERALVILELERTGGEHAYAALRRLHERAHSLWGTLAFCAFDQVQYFGLRPFAPDVAARLAEAFAFSVNDTPALWALKLRGLATCGMHEEGRAMLRRLSPQQLRHLPRDGDYAGTLGHLARAAIELEEGTYFAELDALLLSCEASIAAQLLGGWAGPTAQVAGMLAHAAGNHEQAVQRLSTAVARHAATLPLRGIESRLWLSRALLAVGGAKQRRRASSAALVANDQAERLNDDVLKHESRLQVSRASRN